MVRFATENALSEKGTRAYALVSGGLRLRRSPLARPTPATLKKIRDCPQSSCFASSVKLVFGSGLARTPLSLSSSWNLKVGGDNIPSFDLVLVVLKRVVFSLFLNFGIIDVSSTPGQTDLLNSSEALWDGTSELALQQNFTPFVYSEYVPLKKSHTEWGGYEYRNTAHGGARIPQYRIKI